MIAPGRAKRPGAGAVAEDACPFDAGEESRTPPSTLELGEPWLVRVVPNLYPAFERQEVVVHVPDHRTTFAGLDDAEVGRVAEAWRLRTEAAGAEGFPYVHALVNEGRAAGASRAHTHSQLVWLREPPPAVAGERPEGLGEILARDDLRVGARDGAVAVAHAAGRAPYELVIAGGEVAGQLLLLRDAVRALRALEGEPAWNAWLHAGERPHVHVLPRLTVPAGIELGAGIEVNALAPERAAAALRNAWG